MAIINCPECGKEISDLGQEDAEGPGLDGAEGRYPLCEGQRI